AATDEQTVLDDADNRIDPPLGFQRIVQRAEPAVEDEIAAVRDKGLCCVGAAQLGMSAELFESGGGRLPAELRNLDRQRPTFAEPVDELVLIDDDDEPAARGGNDLLAQQSAAAALDQIEGGALHLIGTIDRKVDPPVLGKARQR